MQKLISIEAWLKLVMGHPIFTGQEMCPTVCGCTGKTYCKRKCVRVYNNFCDYRSINPHDLMLGVD